MFDVGFSELLIIAVVALLVLGPERLPKAARFAGLWVRKARAQWYSVKSELELELAQDEMKKHLQDAENSIKAPMQELQHELQETETEIGREFQETANAIEAEPADEPERSSEALVHSVEAAVESDPTPSVSEQSEPAQNVTDDDLAETPPKQGALW